MTSAIFQWEIYFCTLNREISDKCSSFLVVARFRPTKREPQWDGCFRRLPPGAGGFAWGRQTRTTERSRSVATLVAWRRTFRFTSATGESFRHRPSCRPQTSWRPAPGGLSTGRENTPGMIWRDINGVTTKPTLLANIAIPKFPTLFRADKVTIRC